MKVLMLTTSYPVSKGSSSGVFVRELAKSLSQHVDLKILVPDSSEDSFSEAGVIRFRYAPKRLQTLAHGSGGIPVALKKNRLLFLLIPFFLLSFTFKSVLLGRRVDVIQANWSVCALIGYIVKLIYRTPLVTTFRGEDVDLSSPLKRGLIKAALLVSDRVIAVGDEMAQMICRSFPVHSGKVHTIKNGIDSLFFQSKSSAPSSDNLALISVGSLIPRKNLKFTLEALSLLKEKGCYPELWIVGGGDQAGLVSYAEELGVIDQLHFYGECSKEELVKLLVKASVFVSSSLHEGRPNALLEAMSIGCACLASNINGHRELVGGLGAIFELDDPASLAKHISVYCRDVQACHSDGIKAREYSKENFSTWQSTADEYLNLFAHLIGRECTS